MTILQANNELSTHYSILFMLSFYVMKKGEGGGCGSDDSEEKRGRKKRREKEFWS